MLNDFLETVANITIYTLRTILLLKAFNKIKATTMVVAMLEVIYVLIVVGFYLKDIVKLMLSTLVMST